MKSVCNISTVPQCGFTLIELLVALILLSLLVGFVAPLSIENLDKSKRSQEEYLLKMWLKSSARIAEINSCGFSVELAGKKVFARSTCFEDLFSSERHRTLTLDVLFFEKQSLTLNRFGVYTPDFVRYFWKGNSYQFDPNKALEDKT